MTQREIEKELDALYREVPAMQGCRPGCTACCGPIAFSRTEWARVQDKKPAIGVDCPYALKGRCSIYAQRPFICRIFGASRPTHIHMGVNMTCPKGCGPKKFMADRVVDALMRRYLDLMGADAMLAGMESWPPFGPFRHSVEVWSRIGLHAQVRPDVVRMASAFDPGFSIYR